MDLPSPRHLSLLLAAVPLLVAGCLSRPPAELQVVAGSGASWALSRAAGEKQLEALAQTAQTEEAWLYLMGTWIDIGVVEEKRSVALDLEMVARTTRGWAAFLLPGTHAVFYHLHPFSSDPSIVDPPSLDDLYALAVLKERLVGIRGSSVCGVMLDGRGRWTFDLLPDVARLMLSGRDADYAASHGYMARFESAGRFDLEYSEAACNAMDGRQSAARIDSIGTFIAEARRLGVVITYCAARSCR